MKKHIRIEPVLKFKLPDRKKYVVYNGLDEQQVLHHIDNGDYPSDIIQHETGDCPQGSIFLCMGYELDDLLAWLKTQNQEPLQ